MSRILKRDAAKTVKTGTKGSASRKAPTTPLGNKRAIDDVGVPLPKRKPRDKSQDVTLAEALAEAGQTIEELTAPKAEDRPVRPAGNSNLATTIRNYRKQYAVALTPAGKKTQNNGDAVAQALLHIPLDAMKAFVLGRFPGRTYDHLNPGQQRMCCGNVIRGLVKAGDQTAMLWLETAQVKTEEAGEKAEEE